MAVATTWAGLGDLGCAVGGAAVPFAGARHPTVHRPSRPARVAASRSEELAANLRWSWHRRDPGPVRRRRPRRLGGHQHDPVRLLGAVPAARLRAARGRTRRSSSGWSGEGRPRRSTWSGDRWYQGADATPRPRSPTSRRSSASPPCCRSTPVASASWPATTSRPPATSACRSSGWACSIAHGYFRQSLSREGWQQEPYPVVDPDELPLTLLREIDGSPAKIEVGATGRSQLLAHVWVAQVGRVPLLLLDSDIEDNPANLRDVTDQLYGGGSSTGCCRSCCSASAASGRSGSYCRSPGAGARGLPHQRGPRRLPRPGADPRVHREQTGSTSTRRWRRRAPARCSPPTRRCPPASTGSRAS